VVTVDGQTSVNSGTFSYLPPVIESSSPSNVSWSAFSLVLFLILFWGSLCRARRMAAPPSYVANTLSTIRPHAPCSVLRRIVLLRVYQVLTGSNFGLNPVVLFNGVPLSGCTRPTPTTLSCPSPAGDGLGHVVSLSVAGQNTTAPVAWDYDPPYISRLMPTNGPSANSIITLWGRNFGHHSLSSNVSASTTYVLVGGKVCHVPSDGLTVINDTYIRCMPQPDVLSSAPVRVWVSGQESTEAPISYAFDPAVVHSVTPSSGPSLGGTTVVLRGLNFGPSLVAVVVRFGGTPATGVVHVNDTTIICVTPLHVSGVVPISFDLWPQPVPAVFNLTGPCSAQPCGNGAICTESSANTFLCTCAAGFTGVTCATEIDECSSQPCANGGTWYAHCCPAVFDADSFSDLFSDFCFPNQFRSRERL
jgi:hypothetical protein